MYVETTTRKNKEGKILVKHLLRESYREGKKVKKRTIANLSKYSDKDIAIIKIILRKKDFDHEDLFVSKDIKGGYSIGAFYTLLEILKDVGILSALGGSREGLLSIFQILFRIIHQTSRAGSMRLKSLYPVEESLGLSDIKLVELYNNLDWLHANQEKIEDELFKFKYKDGKVPEGIYLYDITSSYFEGINNELAEFGYNRDKKSGKKQIVIGALTDQDGYILSIKVFRGNTVDHKTVEEQLRDISERFNGVSITFVGDRGMIKSKQIEDLYSHKFHFITGISKAQIQKLVRIGVITRSLFNIELAEIKSENKRYILKLNPVIEEKVRETRKNKYKKLEELVEKKNIYLSEHSRASLEIANKNIIKDAKRLKMNSWIELTSDLKNRKLILSIDQGKLTIAEEFDGCYALITDLDDSVVKETIHERYKGLQKVERFFRTIKTTHLDIRPIYLRKENRTRGHVFISMLSFIVVQELDKRWKNLEYSVKEGIKILDNYSFIDLYAKEKYLFSRLPDPSEEIEKLIDAANIIFPKEMQKKCRLKKENQKQS